MSPSNNFKFASGLQNWIATNWIVFASIVVSICLIFTFVFTTNSGLISRDQFQFMEIVQNWHNGSFKTINIFESHSAHIKPVYKSLFLLNANWFGLNLFYEITLGILFLALISFVLFNSFCNSLKGSISNIKINLAFLLIVLVIFSFNKSHYYTYSLLTLGGFLGTLLFFYIIQIVERGIYNKGKFHLTTLFLLMLFTICGVAGGRSLAFLMSIIAGITFLLLFNSEDRRRRCRILVLFILCGVIVQVLYWAMVSKLAKGSPPINGIETLLENPIGALVFGLKAAASGVFAVARVKKYAGVEFLVAGLGLLVFLTYCTATFLYIRTKMWKRTIFPIILMLYTGAFISQLVIARFGLGFNNAGAPRYVWELQIGFIGCIWIFIYAISLNKKPVKAIQSVKWIFLILFIVCIEGSNSYLFLRHIPFQKKAQAKVLLLVREQAEVAESTVILPSWYCSPGVRKKAKRSILFINQNQLNVFAE